jgi:hypothetical protein
MQELYPKDPLAAPDHADRTAGGSGAQPPLHLIYMVKVGQVEHVSAECCFLESAMKLYFKSTENRARSSYILRKVP